MRKKNIVKFTILFLFCLILFMIAVKDDNKPERELLHASWPDNYESVEEISEASSLIALVEIKDGKKEYDYEDFPMTEYTAEVLQTMGEENIDEDEIHIVMTGIKNSEKYVEVEDDPLLEAGDRILTFLDKNYDGTYRILGGPSGRLVYDERTESVSSLHVVNKEVAEANPYIALEVVEKGLEELKDGIEK